MPTVVVAIRNAVPAPYAYTLSEIQTFRPESVFASWDGTGASGPFLACLTFVSDSGNVFSRTFPSTAIQAGGTADVSYAPFPGGMIAGSISDITSVDGSVVVTGPTGPTTDLSVNIIQSWAYDTITVNAGTNPLVNWNNGAVGAMLNFSTLNTPKFKHSGLVIVTLLVGSPDVNWTPGTFLNCNLQSPAPIGAFPQGIVMAGQSVANAGGSQVPPELSLCSGSLRSINDGVQLKIGNTDAINHSVVWQVNLQQIVGV